MERQDDNSEPLTAEAQDTRPFKSFRHTGHDLTSLKVKFKRDFKLSSWSSVLCMFDNTIWSVYKQANGVCKLDIYNLEGDVVRSACLSHILSPSAIHPFNNHQLVIAGTCGLYRVEADDLSTSIILQGQFTDVYVNQNIMAALHLSDRSKSTVDVVDKANLTVIKRIIIGPFWSFTAVGTSLLVDGDNIFLNYVTPGMKPFIVKSNMYTESCDTIYGTTTVSRLTRREGQDYMKLCVHDSKGAVLLVGDDFPSLGVLHPEILCARQVPSSHSQCPISVLDAFIQGDILYVHALKDTDCEAYVNLFQIQSTPVSIS